MWWLMTLACQPASFEIILKDRHNYSFSSSFVVDSTPISEGEDAQVSWNNLSKDLLGNELDPAEINQLSIVRFPQLTQEAVLIGIENDTLRQSDLSGAVELEAIGRSDAMLSEFSIQGTPLNPEEEVFEELGTYLIFANREERVVSLQFFEPKAGEENQEINLVDDSTTIEYSVSFGEKIGLEDAKELYLDWSDLSQTGTGNPIVLQRIDRLVLAGFRQDLSVLESDFLRSRSLAVEIIEVNVAGIQAIPFSRIEGFEELDPELTWLISLECSLCLNPAPFFVGSVDVSDD